MCKFLYAAVCLRFGVGSCSQPSLTTCHDRVVRYICNDADPEAEPLPDGTQATLDDDFSEQGEDILADVPDHPTMTRSQNRLAAAAKMRPFFDSGEKIA